LASIILAASSIFLDVFTVAHFSQNNILLTHQDFQSTNLFSFNAFCIYLVFSGSAIISVTFFIVFLAVLLAATFCIDQAAHIIQATTSAISNPASTLFAVLLSGSHHTCDQLAKSENVLPLLSS
jgi:hypothetical protein